MSRRARLLLPGVPLHIIQRGNNRQACFFAEQDYRFYLECLAEHAKKAGCRIHAYVLMSNHVHLLLSTSRADRVGKLMKAQGQRYVQYINRSYQRSGTLWEGRFRSCLAQAETWLMACQRYIESNPVRAGMVHHPADYPWSSYRCNAQGELSELVKPHRLYKALGADDAGCRDAYRELFRSELDGGVMDAIRSATNGNYALGTERFTKRVSTTLGRRVVRGQAGRPPKKPDTASGNPCT